MSMIKIPELTESELKRFWSNVDVLEVNDCWTWSAGCDKDGYGYFCFQGKQFRARRVSYVIHVNSQPMICMHTCDTPNCVNPNHLRSGTCSDNTKDRNSKNRQAIGQRVGTSKLTTNQAQSIVKDTRPVAVIAGHYKIDKGTVSNIKSGSLWKHLDRSCVVSGCAGVRNANAKLKESEVVRIFKGEKSAKQLAKIFGVSTQTIYHIQQGRKWAHITNQLGEADG